MRSNNTLLKAANENLRFFLIKYISFYKRNQKLFFSPDNFLVVGLTGLVDYEWLES